MCIVTTPCVQNIVVHFRVPPQDISCLVEQALTSKCKKSRKNFYIFRLPNKNNSQSFSKKGGKRRGTSYTVFPGKGSVIVTGISSSNDILPALESFSQSFSGGKAFTSSFRDWDKKIVNSTHVGHLECVDSSISIHRTLSEFKKEQNSVRGVDDVSISFRSEFFPGILLRWTKTPGSVNLFHNGYYVLVGTKSEDQAQALYNRLCVLMRTCWTTMTRPTLCAWIVDRSSTQLSAVSEKVVNEND